jgi:hypothetical protein
MPIGRPVSSFLAVRRRRLLQRRARGTRHARGERPARRLFGGVGELHRPRPLLAGIDLEVAGAVVAARQAIIRAANGEFFLA